MVPELLVQIALIILIVRSVYVVVQKFQHARHNWLDLLFHASIAVVALELLL